MLARIQTTIDPCSLGILSFLYLVEVKQRFVRFYTCFSNPGLTYADTPLAQPRLRGRVGGSRPKCFSTQQEFGDLTTELQRLDLILSLSKLTTVTTRPTIFSGPVLRIGQTRTSSNQSWFGEAWQGPSFILDHPCVCRYIQLSFRVDHETVSALP